MEVKEMNVEQIEAVVRRVMREEIREVSGQWPRWMSARQVSRYICRPVKSIYNMSQRGEIPCIRTGVGQRGKLVFDRQEIDTWMESFKNS